MPPVVQLIPRTAWRFFLPYLDSGQFCQPWCLYCPKWLCLSGSGLGTLESLSSLCPSTSLLGPWPPFISLSLPPSPLYSIFSSFIPIYFAPQPLLQNLPLPLWTFAASQRYCSRTDSSAISDTVRHMEECWVPKLGDFTSAAKCQRCITDKKKRKKTLWGRR